MYIPSVNCIENWKFLHQSFFHTFVWRKLKYGKISITLAFNEKIMENIQVIQDLTNMILNKGFRDKNTNSTILGKCWLTNI